MIRFLSITFRIVFALAVAVMLLGAGFGALTFWYFGRDLPDYQQLADYQPPIVSRVYAGDGKLLAEYAAEKRVFVPVKAIPPLVIHAFLSAEDRNFYRHPGVDLSSVARAVIINLAHLGSGRRPEGASTITQQVAKNFFFTNEVSYRRKIKEALLAIRMEQALSKDRILELYLNQIFLGRGAYGVAAAALNYFNKSLEDLNVEEAAFLAALPKAPNNYNPQRFPEAAKARRDWVIDRMAEEGYVTAQQQAAAKAAPLVTRRREETETVTASYYAEEVRRELLERYGEHGLYQDGLTVHTSLDPALQSVADRSLRGALIAYDRRHGWRGPVNHLASLSGWQQQLAQIALPAGADEVGWTLAAVLSTGGQGAEIGFADGARGRIPYEELRWARRPLENQTVGPPPRSAAEVLSVGDVVLVEPLGGPTAGKSAAGKSAAAAMPLYGLRQIPAVSGALVAMDPHTGRVLAMTGGFSYEISQFDRVTQARRQPGSSIKPFIYLAALDHGFTPSSIVLDAPLVIDQGPGLPPWNPSNYTHKFYGPLTLRVGVEQSRNLITARLGQAIGLDLVGQYVERFGVMDHMPREYSMLLGAEETTPLRLTTAYAMLVNGGKRITPTFIDRVQDRNGATIYKADNRPCEGCRDVKWAGQAPPELPDTREQIADPQSVYQIVSILQGVVERGTGRIVASVGKPLAGKTGTTNDSKDTWFEGFSPDLAAGVFVGFDTPQTLGQHETGASVAAPAFRDFMAAALKDRSAIPFRIPPGIRLVRVNAATGQLARPGDRNVIYEAFKPGTEPNPEGEGTVAGSTDVTDDESTAADGLFAPAGAPATPVGAILAPAGASVGTSAVSGNPDMPQRAVPASGTGGLY